MKTILTFLVLFLWGTCSSLNAQNQYRSAMIPGVQQIITLYGDELNLTDQQKADLVTLHSELRSERQRPGVRGNWQQRGFNQRGYVRSDRRSGRQGIRGSGIETRWELYTDHQNAIREILTDTQIEQLKNIRLDRIENQHEFRTLRHNAMIERAELDSDKAAEVATGLNRISELQKEMQVQRLENPEGFDRDALQQIMDEIRTIHEELRSTLTVAEYQKLWPGMRAGIGISQRGTQRSSASGRMFMQRRR